MAGRQYKNTKTIQRQEDNTETRRRQRQEDDTRRQGSPLLRNIIWTFFDPAQR